MNEVLADRYEITGVLGSGGMGDVYRARDRLLAREVAIKRLRAGDDEAERRFLREAQIQARVEHENVCKVYEVSWDERHRPFIVMQLIQGETLTAAARSMSLEQKIAALRAVCEAVHAAHKLGLIHRDLKPANVLVEATPGGFTPYVTDFGLARDLARKASLFTTSLAGTPQYMAPEQAGGSQQIDARTDVWGLGATLYELLSGQMPFGTGSPVAVLRRVQRDEPKALSKLVPGLPRGLETIVGKCLAKEPEQRYGSAQDLAEDLRRFLAHEPIAARPPSLAVVARATVRRHRAASASVAVALVAALGFLALYLVQRAQAEARAATAARMGRDVKELEQAMRLSLALPLHDTTAEAKRARARLAALEDELRVAGKELAGPGLAVLGRGHLALRDFPAALEKLRAAWALGNRDPDAAVALGLAASAVYGQAGGDPRWRDEVLAALRAASGATGMPPEYVEALLRFHEGALEQAEVRAREALRRTPWLYDAHVLLGEIARARGVARRTVGNASEAQAFFSHAEEEYAAAADIGRSDARVFEGLCTLQLDAATLGGAGREAALRKARKACDDAVRAAPYLESARALRSRIDAVAAGDHE